MTNDPYVVLGVPRTASFEEIRAAWTNRINAAAGSGDLGLAKRIDAAYELLCDSYRRAHFERTGTIIEAQRPAPEPMAVAAVRDWTETTSLFTEPTSASKASRRPRLRAPTVTLLVLIVLVVGGIFAFENHKVPQNKLFAKSLGSTLSNRAVQDEAMPTIHGYKPPPRALAPVAGPAGHGGYKLLDSARWDPCQTIHYQVYGTTAIPGADAMLQDAIAEVSKDTGLSFTNDGPSVEPPRLDRPAYQPTVYGDRWAPVLIAWTTPQQVAKLAGPTTGIGGADGVRIDGHDQDVSGVVFFDSVQLLHQLYAKDGTRVIRATMLHELGHLVGLGHVRDRSSIMFPESRLHGPASYSAADRRGLAYVGGGPCLPWTTAQ